MKEEILLITDKRLIQKITSEVLFNEIHLHIDHKNYKAYCFDDYTKFEIKWDLSYYKIKNILKELKIKL